MSSYVFGRVGLELTALQPYGDRWKRHRKVLHRYLNHEELHTTETRELVQRNLDDLLKEIKRTEISAIRCTMVLSCMVHTALEVIDSMDKARTWTDGGER